MGEEREGERKESGRGEGRGEGEVAESSEVRVQGRREEESGEDEGLGSETKLDRPPSAGGHGRRVETGEREEGVDQERETERGGGEKVLEPTQQSPSPSSPPPTNTTVQSQPHSLGLV